MDAAAPELARLRVVQFVPSLWHGGAELVAVSLALALRDRIERLVIASSGGDPYTERVRTAGIPLEIVPRPWARPWALFRSASALARLLRRERPHVVHAHNPGASAAAALARRLARMPEVAIVATYHGVPPLRVKRARRALGISADLVVGVTPSATRDLGLPEAQSATIFNAVEVEARRPAADVRAEFGVPEGVPLVINVGRHVEQKNQALLVDALAGVRRPLKALLVGDGPLTDALRARISAAGVADELVLTGERADVPDLVGAADVFVLSSDWEALPLVVLEAMSLGTPVASTAVGGVPDVIEDGASGLLVPPGDEAALTAAVRRILDEPGLADRLAAAGKSFVDEHCSLPAMVAAYLDVYRDAIDRRAGRRPST